MLRNILVTWLALVGLNGVQSAATTPSTVGACLYKGQIHQQGETWQDGCDYECECTDASKGMYKCTERCQRIASIPTGCQFGVDPNDACCQKLFCDPTAALGTCKDNVNCQNYGAYVCEATYKDWATQNCAKYCGFCGGGSGPATTPAGSGTSGTGTLPGTGGTGTGASGSGTSGTGTVPGTGGTGTGQVGGTGTDTGTGTGGTGTGTGGTGTGTGTGTGGTGLVTQTPGSGFTGFRVILDGIWYQTGGTSTETGGGACFYKGKYYPMGDNWVDGCDYNCTCENGQTGFYRCRDRCPTYGQLPAGCVMKKPAGECCGVPDCSGITGGTGTGTDTGTGGTGTGTGTGTGGTGTGTGGTGTGTGGTGTGTGTGTGGTGTATGTGNTGIQTGTQPGCFYKNHLYQQGETWKDACTYKCTCVDANAHQYQCASLCLNWQLPSSCHLDPPAAGKCCQTPNCPSNVILNYPPGYVAE